MQDIGGRILGVILAFTLLIVAPLTIMTFADDLENKRALMNEAVNIIDKITDTGTLTDLQLSDFYLGVSSYGVIVDAKITRYLKVVSPDGSGGSVTTYMVADNITNWNKGDICKVTIKAIDYTGAQRIAQRLMHTFVDPIEFTLSGQVR